MMGINHFFSTREIRPRGWLRRQLEIQAKGLSGNLDKVWPDIRDSAWIGGNCEGWERVPYWLDGFIPLAYLLEDEDMIARVRKYIDAIITGQDKDGWLCPCKKEDIPEYDTWAVQLISKVLVVYYQCSGDDRIPDVIYKMMKNYHYLLTSGVSELNRWAKSRWFESFIALNFLYERGPEPWMEELAEFLADHGLDYRAISDVWKRPLNRWTHETHVVNLAMMIKTEAVTKVLLGDRYAGQASELYNMLMKYNGTPVGIFTGDECLSGLSPIQGTELCAVAELMYSAEWLYVVTSDEKWAELLELVTFNALPATMSDDMWAHQYDQQSNQISCERFPGRPIFRTNGEESHLFGLEPNFGCCTANHNQAWPKFALSAFMRCGDTVLSAIPVPSSVETDGINITLDTEYPFKNYLSYTVNPGCAFTFKVRVPAFAQDVTVNGKPSEGGILTFDIAENTAYTISISFTTRPVYIDATCGLKSVKCGSLIFALPIVYEKRMFEYERNGVERKYPYCDYEYIGRSEWRYGFTGKELNAEEQNVNEIPFSSEHPPVTISTTVQPIEWDYEDGFETVCAKLPTDTKPLDNEVRVQLYPYGCAKLRMTQMPFVEK